MVTDHGVVSADLTPLLAAVQALPSVAWTRRSDPESETTTTVRENTEWFPRAVVTQLLDRIGPPVFGPGYYNRLVLSCVPAGCDILPHVDDFGSMQHTSYHCHLPLVSHPDVVIGGDAGEQHLAVGRLYRLDATQRHWVRNPSPVDRVHLLFAYVPHHLRS